jgi:intracellular sulfur oxidation DsrE/DsrF family protein
MKTRKDFLIAGSLVALAPAAAPAATPLPAPAPASADLTFTFDRPQFDAMLAKRAKHRQCFGAAKIDDGGVLEGMENSLNAYERFLGEGPGAMHAVAVLYHGPSIAIAFSDELWRGLMTQAIEKQGHAAFGISAAQSAKGNPYLHPPGASVEGLVARGCNFFVCHNAIAGVSEYLAAALQRPVAGVHGEILAGLVPGSIPVPAGVMAINAAQEAHFTYIQSSV